MLNDEIISDDEIARTINRDSEREGGGEVEEIGEEDEEGRMKTIHIRNAYVALRRLRWKIREKPSKQKQKRKRRATKWMFEKDREDRDWKPPRSKRKKMKAPPRIKLVRRRPISEDEETEPSYHRPLQRRAWRGTNLRHQSEEITFYKNLHKRRIKEGKKRQRKRRREEEQGVRGGGVTTTAPTSEGARRSPPGRQDCLRKSDSGVWEAEQRGYRTDGPEHRERLEINLETTQGEQGEEQEVCHMEGRGHQDTVAVDIKVAVGQDCEEKSGTKQSPDTKEEIGYRGVDGAKEEDVSEEATAGADSERGRPGEGGYPEREGGAAEEGEIVEEAKEDELHRPSVALTTSGVDIPTAPILGVQDLLRKWVEEGVHGLACEVRVRSTAEGPPPPRDQELSRGGSLR